MGFLKCETSCGGFTLPETNIFGRENWPGSKKDMHLPNHQFAVCYCCCVFEIPNIPNHQPPGMVLKPGKSWDVKLPFPSTGELCQIHRAESSGPGSKLRLVEPNIRAETEDEVFGFLWLMVARGGGRQVL